MTNDMIIGIVGIVLGMAGLAGLWELRRSFARPGATKLVAVVIGLAGVGVLGWGAWTLASADRPGELEGGTASADENLGKAILAPGAKADIGQPLIAGAGPPPDPNAPKKERKKGEGKKGDGKKGDGKKEGDPVGVAPMPKPKNPGDLGTPLVAGGGPDKPEPKPEEKEPPKPEPKPEPPKKNPGDLGKPLIAGGGPERPEPEKKEPAGPVAPPPREKKPGGQ